MIKLEFGFISFFFFKVVPHSLKGREKPTIVATVPLEDIKARKQIHTQLTFNLGAWLKTVEFVEVVIPVFSLAPFPSISSCVPSSHTSSAVFQYVWRQLAFCYCGSSSLISPKICRNGLWHLSRILIFNTKWVSQLLPIRTSAMLFPENQC